MIKKLLNSLQDYETRQMQFENRESELESRLKAIEDAETWEEKELIEVLF